MDEERCLVKGKKEHRTRGWDLVYPSLVEVDRR